MTGDFAAARLMLQRAAEGGGPPRFLGPRRDYDPIEVNHLATVSSRALRQRGPGYEKAEQFGSAEARRRLELLAKRDP